MLHGELSADAAAEGAPVIGELFAEEREPPFTERDERTCAQGAPLERAIEKNRMPVARLVARHVEHVLVVIVVHNSSVFCFEAWQEKVGRARRPNMSDVGSQGELARRFAVPGS